MTYCIKTDLSKKNNVKYAEQVKALLKSWTYLEKDFEYLFIIGGDGSFLHHAKPYLNFNIKIILINSGKLGFYSYIKDIKNFKIDEITNITNYTKLDLLTVKYNGNITYAINDISYYSNYTSIITTYINDILLQTIHGNGMLITTPMGSTARNKSLGGAILMPNTQTFSLIEIEAINNKYFSSLGSPLVISNKDKVKIETDSYRSAFLLIDGLVQPIKDKKTVLEIFHSSSKAKILIKTDQQNWTNKLNDAFANN